MKFKAALALATLASFSAFAQTEIHVQDLNFIPKEKQFFYNGDVEISSGESTREVRDTGVIIEVETKSSEALSTHLLGYGLTDRLTAFIGFSYDFKNETEIDNFEQNGASQNVSGTTKDDGLSYIMFGGNWRFLEQNANSINGDLRFSYSQGVQDAERGATYDSNGDGNDDSGSSGNTSQIAPDVTVGVFLGKKLEQFEVRGGLNFHFSGSGDYKLIKGESSTIDYKVSQDSFVAVQYLLEGQLKLNEQFYLYGNLSAMAISDVNSDYTNSSGDKNEIESRATTMTSLSVGAKFVFIPNQFYGFAQLSGTSAAEQKIVTKTNGVRDNDSDKITESTSSAITLGLAASF